jgi:adenylate cyclase
MERRLAAIFAADAVGYSRLMGIDEEATFAALATRRQIIDAVITSRGGRIFGTAGDSVVAEFQSSVEAVRSAVEIQIRLQETNRDLPEAERMAFRIGVNFGDIMVKDQDILGDGVNVAARLEGLSPAGGVCISQQVAEQISGKLDVDFANAGRHRLKNIAKPVEVWLWPPEAAAKLRRLNRNWRRVAAFATVLLAAALAGLIFVYESPRDGGLPSGPRIAVIPFSNLGSNPDDAYFSDGLTRDINAYLSKFSNLFVIAPAAGAGYRDTLDCKQVRSELETDYILTGAVQRSLDHLRVTTTFMDARTCRQLDSPGPFDRDLSVASVLDIQLEIAKKVAAEIGSADAPLFNADVQTAIRQEAPDNLEAYECVLLSYWFYETFAPERHSKARACLERAVKIDPDYSLGWSRLAFSYIETKKYAIDTPANWAALSEEAANRAIDLDPDNPDAYYALAILSQATGQDNAVFQGLAERAIELNPNDAFVLADLGTWMGYTGAWEKGKEWIVRAKQLNPNHQSWWDWIWVLDYYRNGEYAEARDVALKINLPGNYVIQSALTASYGMLGEQAKAEAALARLLELRPDYPEDPRAPFLVRGMEPALIEALMEGLRRAGLDVPT